MATQAITFDYTAWVAAFPTFAAVNSTDAQSFFDTAGMFCANDTSSPAFGIQIPQSNVMTPLLQRLLWLLTCHLAFLGSFRNATGQPSSTGTQPPSPLVGRVSSAGEGSVNVSTDLDSSGYPTAAFFSQTPWGLQFWQASAQFRTARYVARPTFIPDGVYPALPFGRRGIY